jgi:transcriptional regulator with XRE-family HTH domain
MGEDIDRLVADRLRQVRLDRGLTLTQLAQLTGISIAHLSRIEKGERQPSIGSLLQLARAYGVSIGALVDDLPERDYHLVRAGEAAVHQSGDARYEVLSGPHAGIAVVTVELPPGASTADAHHVGEEWLHAVVGSLLVRMGDNEIVLKPGDSLQFDSAVVHSLHNPSKRAVRALIASSSTSARHPVSGIPRH